MGNIKIYPYYQKFVKVFEKKKQEIVAIAKDVEFHHIGSTTYRNFLAFRDYLRKHPKESEKYFELKLIWHKEAKGERAVYTKMKNSYIKEILKKATK